VNTENYQGSYYQNNNSTIIKGYYDFNRDNVYTVNGKLLEDLLLQVEYVNEEKNQEEETTESDIIDASDHQEDQPNISVVDEEPSLVQETSNDGEENNPPASFTLSINENAAVDDDNLEFMSFINLSSDENKAFYFLYSSQSRFEYLNPYEE